ncbi:MAG: DUF6521 family protein [Rhodoferax sp.]|uniref:three component ABC system middle component n=1 Tax=Rhodoferax sp. TaxID=50421 RepID=UPI0026181FEC|nr:three component ABC system middle component [Rhodoferax sp.]MDD5333913.1 DUF6521 family protein [Rhodoferax sp.]
MTSLAREVQNVQNPALGATLLWRFCCGFVDASPTCESPQLPIVFLVLPVVLHRDTAEFVTSTQKRSGLRAFATKFGDSRVSKQDLLLQLHDRTARWKVLSLHSLELAVAGQLLSVTDSGTVLPLSRTNARGMADDVRQLMVDAEKLGHWCGQLTTHEIANTLKVRF